MDIDTLHRLPLNLPDIVAQVVVGMSGTGELIAYGHERPDWLTLIVRRAPGRYTRIVVLPNQLVDASYMSYRLLHAALQGMPDVVLLGQIEDIPEDYTGLY